MSVQSAEFKLQEIRILSVGYLLQVLILLIKFLLEICLRLFTTFSKKFKLYQKILVFSDVDKITLLKSLKKFKLYQKILVFSDVDKITLLNLLVDKLSKLTVIGSV